MTGRRGDRRASRRLVATIVGAALVLAACGDAASSTDSTLSTPVDAVGVPTDHGLSETRLAEVIASTVGIEGVACGRLAHGSGFALTAELIVTNAHVILGMDEIRVFVFDGRELRGVPVSFDPDADLAILEVADADLVPLPLAADAESGSIGAVFGWEDGPFPDPTPYRIERPVTVRIERVGGTERIERRSWLLAAEIDLGDSGAAMVDPSGEVVGVTFATSTATRSVGYAVRSSEIEALMARGMDANLTVPDC
ncbi:MAG: trypsin-like peptidase domain-containing protein [Acidimicrobiales bacterium]|nr:trypsin-like peptidase domain-containing protein [Acidimicrobiales bacterium]